MSKMTTNKARKPGNQHRQPVNRPPLNPSRLYPGLEAYSAGVLPQKRDWIHQRFQFFALGWVLSGTGTYQVDKGPIQPITPGSVFTVYPGPIFHYGPTGIPSAAHGSLLFDAGPRTLDSGPPSWEECFVIFRGPNIKHLLKNRLFFTDAKVHPAPPPPSLIPRWRQMVDHTRSTNPRDHDQALLMALGFLLEVEHARHSATQPRTTDPLIDAARQRLAALHPAPISLPSLAAQLGVSYSTLRQRFTAVTGQGPAHWLAQHRCENAQRLLADTDAPIKQIATQVGIPDPFSFSRLFKRLIGVSPENYRKQSRPFHTYERA